jgi:flagellar biosynthesis protein FliR
MISLKIDNYIMFVTFWICFSRWLAVIFQLPIFDGIPVPSVVKILTTLIITYAFFPYTNQGIAGDLTSIGAQNAWIVLSFNVIVGLAIGFLVKSILLIFTASGALITQQVGFSAVQYFDPMSSAQIGPFEKLIQWTVLVIIISTGALLPIFKGIFISFASINLSNLGNFSNITVFYLDMFKSIFLSATLLSSPIIFSNLLIMTVLGIIAKMVPQMNVLMVSFVVNIGMGLLIFYSILDEYFHVAVDMYIKKLSIWFQFVN